MDRFKFEAFKDEFPFAFGDDVDAKELDFVQVKRLDDRSMSYLCAEYVDIGNSLFSAYGDTTVSIWGKQNNNLGWLTQSRRVGTVGVQHQPDAMFDNAGETLLEWCLTHRDVLDNVGFVVEDSRGYDTTADDCPWRTITIYKLPKRHTLKEFVDAAMAKSKAEVRKESTF